MKYHIQAILVTIIGIVFMYGSALLTYWLQRTFEGIEVAGIVFGSVFIGTGYVFLIVILWIRAFNNGNFPSD